MTGKRFINVNHEIWQGNDVWCVAGGEHCADVIATALNEQHETITEQASQIDFLKDENTHMRNVLNENKQLQQRNNRQAKQLDRLYNLVGEKDWRTLSDILDDFKRCEEQLQKEWGTYGDVE